MILSDGEKLILVMLVEIYRHHKIKGEVNPELVLQSILGNQTWALKWQYPSVFHNAEEPPEVVSETCEILDMYQLLTPSFDKLSAADKKRVEKETDPFNKYVRYQGFDANNDDHFSVVQHLVKHMARYNTVQADLNSHSSGTITTYRRMLKKFKLMIDPYPDKGLSTDQIIQILKVEDRTAVK